MSAYVTGSQTFNMAMEIVIEKRAALIKCQRFSVTKRR